MRREPSTTRAPHSPHAPRTHAEPARSTRLLSQEILTFVRSLGSSSSHPTVTKPEFVLNTLKYLASIMRLVVLDRDITLNGQVANFLATILPANARVLHVRYTLPGNPENALRYAFMPNPKKSQCMPMEAEERFRLHVRRCARSFRLRRRRSAR